MYEISLTKCINSQNLFTHEYRMPLTLQTNDIDVQCIEPYFDVSVNGSDESTFLLYYAQTQKH